MNETVKKWYERGKQLLGFLAIFYPIFQAYTRGHGWELPDLSDYTAKTQIAGALLLAQSNKLIKAEKNAK